MKTALKAAAQLLLFFVAVVVFFLGLGIGLQVNSALGTLLWLTAAAILAANLVWLVRSRI